MAALEATLSLCPVYSSSSSSAKFPKPFLYSLKFHNSISAPPLSHNLLFHPSLPITNSPSRKLCFELCSAVQEIVTEEKSEKTHESNQKKKLFVVNLPWSLTVVDIKNLFGECGTVVDVEIIKQKGGRSRGFAFVTMASGEEAQAVIDKFHSQEVSGRAIRIEFAKRFKKPSPPRPPGPQPGETRHKLYVSNLEWKVRSSHLREFFSTNFNPVAARVVFDAPSGKSAGYGFVSFATREEAEEAISTLDGKELMGRPLRLKFSEKNTDKSENQKEEQDQPEES
ncbi:hypothetical protein FEM48_Zijuj11G0088500 [Ziziphus jujuba var. spinosa]|uniref:RRM domain-containing protein n=1 Tax=Ziziphus jujuba var. spinosa TaxID=714518 RepID=A0A978UHZ6_ZIZJJ|nr:hypothetical protein FEM48_Zijuj11G0088500 [Ziziphus jujuba var. spinosa]